MTSYSVPYGKSVLSFDIPNRIACDVIAPQAQSAHPDPVHNVSEAIQHPLGTVKLADFADARSVAIAINDKTRPVPNHLMIPPLLDRLHHLGFHNEQITFYIATGTHLPMPEQEFPIILPDEIRKNYRVLSHKIDDDDILSFLGETPYHTPVFINSDFYFSDLKIVTGNIEPHHFAGFSGGMKTAAIGLAGRQTITKNHNLLTEPNAIIGEYDHNPLRQDIEKIGEMIGVHFALNTILTEDKRIIQTLFGSPKDVMLAGIPISRSICQISITEMYDLVIASAGGYPKDINLYQAQKAITHASMLTRQGGHILLLAECIEGIGSQSYVNWMHNIHSIDEVFQKVQKEGLIIGPHKAYQFARLMSHFDISIKSSIDPDLMLNLLHRPIINIQHEIDAILEQLKSDVKIAILPQATHTIPYIIS